MPYAGSRITAEHGCLLSIQRFPNESRELTGTGLLVGMTSFMATDQFVT